MRKKRPPKKETKLTIAIHGEGVGLKDVGLRQLAQLLEATAGAFEAVAREKRLEPPKLSLAKAKRGSAAYDLVSEDPQAERVTRDFVSTVRKRGKGSSPQTRSSLARLYSVGTKTSGAGLRIDPDGTAGSKSRSVYLASPVDDDSGLVEEGTVVYARVTGLKLDFHDRGTVVLRYDDGGSGEFGASPDLLSVGARLLGRHVVARVTFQRGERDFEGEVESLEERAPPSSLLDAVTDARRALLDHGVVFDARAWFAEAEEDHRE